MSFRKAVFLNLYSCNIEIHVNTSCQHACMLCIWYTCIQIKYIYRSIYCIISWIFTAKRFYWKKPSLTYCKYLLFLSLTTGKQSQRCPSVITSCIVCAYTILLFFTCNSCSLIADNTCSKTDATQNQSCFTASNTWVNVWNKIKRNVILI